MGDWTRSVSGGPGALSRVAASLLDGSIRRVSEGQRIWPMSKIPCNIHQLLRRPA